MRTLYLECSMGAAGDMLAAALLELLEDKQAFIDELNALGLRGVSVSAESSKKCGITGTHFAVTVGGKEEESRDVHHHDHDHDHHGHDHHGQDHDHHHHHHGQDHDHDHHHDHGHEHHHDDHGHHHDQHHEHCHSGLKDIERIVNGLPLTEGVRADVMAVYGLIAGAESHSHGVPVSEIHFHEVGTMDAIMDITAVCLLMDRIAPDEVIASPIHVGSGMVRCAHGILPVPAPATAHILRDAPIYGGGIQGELCTPTGAALIMHFADRFGPMPLMQLRGTGYGMGKKDFPAANCLRAMLGESGLGSDSVVELSCNVDDMTAEGIGFALEQLMEQGALEAYTLPIGMKKCRPGTMICLMCRQADEERLVGALFRLTSTIGIRRRDTGRYVLARSVQHIDTPYGQVRRKCVSGHGVERAKYEYEDVARIARENGVSIEAAIEMVRSQRH